jgi:hypothetical protein
MNTIIPDQTYEIVEDGKAIKCLLCGLTSYHPKDVEHRYCGHCKAFHEDLAMARRVAIARREGLTDGGGAEGTG